MTSPLPISAASLKVLEGLKHFGDRHGRWPSVRELAKYLGSSATSTYQHLRALKLRGVITSNGTSNSHRPIEACPTCGRTA